MIASTQLLTFSLFLLTLTDHVGGTPDRGHVRNKRIIGGLPAPVHERYQFAPAMRSIIYLEDGFGQCGSSIIGKRHVLTAAHCVVLLNETSRHKHDHTSYLLLKSDELWIDTRLLNIVDDLDSDNFNVTTKFYVHPGYQRYNNDIAIIEFPEGFDFKIDPILLPDDFVENPGEMAFSVGYGRFNEFFDNTDNLTHARILREGVFLLRDPKFCKNIWAKPDTDKKICAGELGRGTARGDSGGPMMKNGDDGKWYQIGICSYGNRQEKYNRRDYPGISTRVSYYCPWIERVTRGEVLCIKYERPQIPLDVNVVEKMLNVSLKEEIEFQLKSAGFGTSGSVMVALSHAFWIGLIIGLLQ